jgi:cytochrome P450
MTKTMTDIPLITSDYVPEYGAPSLQTQVEWARDYGPIYRRDTEYGPFIFMVGPEANRFVFHTGRQHFSHDQGWTPIIGETLGHGLLNMDDPEHAVHRRMWNPAFTAAAMEAYVPIILRVIAERTRHWPELDSVDVYKEAREITFDAAAAALAGFAPGPEVDRMRRNFNTLIGFDPEELTYEQWQQKARAAQAELGAMMLGLIHARRNAPDTEKTHDVLGMIVRAKDEQGQPLSDMQIMAHLNILLVAGHETTTTLSAWVLAMLATEHAHRQRILAELDAVMGDAPAPTVEQLRNLPALDNFIKETGRLHSPVFNVPRGVVSDFEFAGYHVPAGHNVRLGLAAGHRLSAVFADPEKFDPDRFAAPREEDKKQPYSLVTFGGGARICIGINFANIETKALAVHALRHFDMALLDEEVIYAGYWTAFLPNGLHMRFKQRET